MDVAAVAAHVNVTHARGLGGAEPRLGILEDEAARGRDLQHLGGMEEEIGERLAPLDLVGTDHLPDDPARPRLDADMAQGVGHDPGQAAGGDNDPGPGPEAFQQGDNLRDRPDAGQKPDEIQLLLVGRLVHPGRL